MGVRRLALWAATVLLLASCANDAFTRDHAVMALQSTGASEVESTCIADTLLALGELDAADPRVEPTETGSDAFRSARGRCVQVEVLGASETQVVDLADVKYVAEETPFTNADEEASTGASGVAPSSNQAEVEVAAMATLEGFGYSAANARCIVDHLVAVEAWSVLSDASLGLGRDALEANAMAACTGTS